MISVVIVIVIITILIIKVLLVKIPGELPVCWGISPPQSILVAWHAPCKANT